MTRWSWANHTTTLGAQDIPVAIMQTSTEAFVMLSLGSHHWLWVLAPQCCRVLLDAQGRTLQVNILYQCQKGVKTLQSNVRSRVVKGQG